jgi:hypothetical protein
MWPQVNVLTTLLMVWSCTKPSPTKSNLSGEAHHCRSTTKLKNKTVPIELSVKSPSVVPSIDFAFAYYHLFQWYPKSKEILLNLGMKCWNLAFNAPGLRVIIVVQVVETLRKKERQDETQFTTNKIGEKTSLGSSYILL